MVFDISESNVDFENDHVSDSKRVHFKPYDTGAVVDPFLSMYTNLPLTVFEESALGYDIVPPEAYFQSNVGPS